MGFDFGGLIPPGIAGGAALIGQHFANQSNRREGQRNRDWQERMSNTSYQRMMADMRAAGLNPMLAFMKGGASTPSGSQSAPMQNELGAAANSAMEMKRLTADYDKIRKDTELSQAMIDSNHADVVLKNANSAKTLQEAEMLGLKIPKEYVNNFVYGALSNGLKTVTEDVVSDLKRYKDWKNSVRNSPENRAASDLVQDLIRRSKK